METLWQDLRYGVRVLWKSRGFTLVSVMSLALGIGANTAIFTVANAVFLQPLPVRDPQTLVSLFTLDDKVPGQLPIAYPNYEDLRKQTGVFEEMAAVSPVTVNIALEGGAPSLHSGEMVSGHFFQFLGVQAAQGRAFTASDDGAPGANPVAVISHGLWMRKFGGKPDLIGRTVLINRLPCTVLGVMPAGFRGLNTLTEPAVWLPTSMSRHLVIRADLMRDRKALFFYVFARLKQGVSIVRAASETKAAAAQLEGAFAENRGRTIQVVPTSEATINPGAQQMLRRATVLMMAVVGFVLMIACANVAGLLMVRGRARTKEFAIRLAVGAGAMRITRQLITESLLLSIVGGTLGLLVARWTRDLLWAQRPPLFYSFSIDLSFSPRILAFAFGLSILSGVLFGLAPALNAWRKDLASDLKERTSQVVSDRGIFNTRGVLVVAQCALSVIALVGAALFVESLRQAQKSDPGFETERIVLMRFSLGAEGFTKERGLEYFRQVQERVSGIPAVKSVTFSGIHPFIGGGYMRSVFTEGQDTAARPHVVLTNPIGTRYVETIRIRLLDGRDFTAADRAGAPGVLIVNDSLARRLWSGESAVGKRIRFSADKEFRQVVGVIADSKFNSMAEQPQACVYMPLAQEYMGSISMLVQTASDPRPVLSAIRGEVQRVDASLPQGGIQTMQAGMDRSLWPQRMVAGLLASFGALGLALASIGVYGLTAYAVAQRVNEIGIRMALGATSGDVMKMIIGHSMKLVIPGLLLGILTALGLARWTASLLFGVETWYPPAYAAAALLLILVALAACWLPSRRAIRIDPVLALRQE